MAFHEVSLPARLAFGSTGGVERRTEIVTLGSGSERRSTPWADGRRRYLIGAQLRSLDDMAVNALYAALFEPGVRELHLTNLPESQMQGPDYLNVLKITDIPEVKMAIADQTDLKLLTKEQTN